MTGFSSFPSVSLVAGLFLAVSKTFCPFVELKILKRQSDMLYFKRAMPVSRSFLFPDP